MAALLIAGCAGCTPGRRAGPEAAHPRIVSLAPSLTEIIAAVGGGSNLAGRSSACDFPPDLVQRTPVVGAFGVPSIERILERQPEAVVYTDLADPALAQSMKEHGLNPVGIACSRLSEIPAAIRTVGTLLQKPESANRIAQTIEEQIQARRNLPPLPHRPKVLVLIWNDPLTAAGRDTFIADLVRLAGGENVGDDVGRDYFRVSREWVLARNPEMIFCFFMADHHSVRQALLAIPEWSHIPAILSRKVYDGFDNNLVVRPGPRVMEGVALLSSYIRVDSNAPLGHASSATP